MQFHIICFEGPDGYARAGGIASRITGLSEALAEAGCDAPGGRRPSVMLGRTSSGESSCHGCISWQNARALMGQ